MTQTSPGKRDPHAYNIDHVNNAKFASYRFAQSAAKANFDWQSAHSALLRAKRSARALGLGLGLFEASGREGNVWMVSGRSRWEIVHSQNDDMRGLNGGLFICLQSNDKDVQRRVRLHIGRRPMFWAFPS